MTMRPLDCLGPGILSSVNRSQNARSVGLTMNVMSLQKDDLQELRQACFELRERLRAGESTRVEDMLTSHPALAGNDEAALELIHAEVCLRNEMGERPSLEELQE